MVTAWALEGDLDASAIASNLVEIAWPPRSGKTLLVPELDRAGWFAPDEARRLVVKAQAAFVDRLEEAAQVRWSKSPLTQPMWRSAERRTTALASDAMTFAKLP